MRFFVAFLLIAFLLVPLRMAHAQHTPLVQAIAGGRLDTVRELLATNPELVRERDGDGNTPLNHAAWAGNLLIAQALVTAGADIKAQKNSGETSLHDAARGGHVEIMKYLVEHGADVRARDKEGAMPLHAAAWTGQVEAARYLLDAGVEVDSRTIPQQVTALERASYMGHNALIRFLLSRGADVRGRVYDGNTPLHQAARTGHTPEMQILVEAGADVNAARDDGQTPLHIAAGEGQTGAVQVLLAMGGRVDARARDESTPLAAALRNGRGDTAAFLQRYLATLNETASLVLARDALNKTLEWSAKLPRRETTVYQSDWAKAGVGPEWTTNSLGAYYGDLRTSTLPNNTAFLGNFGSQNVRLSLSGLPAHTTVTVTLDLYVLGSWDGDGGIGPGPDLWEASVTGGPLLTRTTFYNNMALGLKTLEKASMQSFPGDYGLAHHPGHTGAVSFDTLHFGDTPEQAKQSRDAVYRLKFTFVHNAPYIVLNFAGKNLQEISDESWGIGNVTVQCATLAGAPAKPTPARPKRTR